MRAAQPNRAQPLGVGINPVALHAQLVGQGCGIDQPDRTVLWFIGTQQLDDAPGDRLDQVGFAAGLDHVSFGLSILASEFVLNTAKRP